MIKRYVLDGPPGSAKSTLLFGFSDGEAHMGRIHSLRGLMHNCIHESVAEAHGVLADQGTDYQTDKELWLRTIIEIDRKKFAMAREGLNFYDRCVHHWRLLSEARDIALPEWYDEVEREIRYDDPVFVVAPVASIDLGRDDVNPSRRFSWDDRVKLYGRTIGLYRGLGYQVIEVPMFHEGDIERNNRARIDLILKHVE